MCLVRMKIRSMDRVEWLGEGCWSVVKGLVHGIWNGELREKLVV
jgi:hypothetical protein